MYVFKELSGFKNKQDWHLHVCKYLWRMDDAESCICCVTELRYFLFRAWPNVETPKILYVIFFSVCTIRTSRFLTALDSW